MPLSNKYTEPDQNPLGDPKAYRGVRTSLEELSRPVKQSDVVPPFKSSFGSFVLEIIKILVIALIIIKPIHYFLIQPFYVKGQSMEPNFYNNEYLIVDELSYRLHDPRRGDVVVLKNPFNQKEFFIKRVIGLPGEKVTVTGGQIKITNTAHPNGMYLDQRSFLAADVLSTPDDERVLGLNEYYVMGDNRPASFDSRSFGPIPRSSIVGRTALRAWPIPRVQVFRTPILPLLTQPIPTSNQ